VASNPVPDWFHDLVIEGVQMLYALSLQGCPSAETLTLTAQVWIDTMWRSGTVWQEAADAARLHDAFVRIAGTTDRWPAPKQVLNCVSGRQERTKLNAPGLTPEEIVINKRRLAEVMKAFQPKKIESAMTEEQIEKKRQRLAETIAARNKGELKQ